MATTMLTENIRRVDFASNVKEGQNLCSNSLTDTVVGQSIVPLVQS